MRSSTEIYRKLSNFLNVELKIPSLLMYRQSMSRYGSYGKLLLFLVFQKIRIGSNEKGMTLVDYRYHASRMLKKCWNFCNVA